jgi:hypothetical protein
MTYSMKFTQRRRTMSDEDICRRYAETGSSVDVSLEAGCSSTTVLQIVRAHGGTVGPSGGKGMTTELALSEADICRRYLDGENGIRLAYIAGCCTSTLYRILKANGVQARRNFDHLKRRPRRPA